MPDVKRQVTWFFAFKTLLNGIGSKGMFGLKAGILVSALASPFVSALIYLDHVKQVSGNVPPVAPTIKTAGSFVRKVKMKGGHEVGYIEFITDGGQIYAVDSEVWFKGQEALARENPSRELYVEGFLLENGKGSFFSTFVAARGGPVILTPEKAMMYLIQQRDYKNFPGFFYIVAVLWIVSLINIYRLKRKLSAEYDDGLSTSRSNQQ